MIDIRFRTKAVCSQWFQQSTPLKKVSTWLTALRRNGVERRYLLQISSSKWSYNTSLRPWEHWKRENKNKYFATSTTIQPWEERERGIQKRQTFAPHVAVLQLKRLKNVSEAVCLPSYRTHASVVSYPCVFPLYRTNGGYNLKIGDRARYSFACSGSRWRKQDVVISMIFKAVCKGVRPFYL